MKILLINPFGSNWVEGREDVTETAIRMAPIGILSIAAYLLEKGHEVEVHDCRGAVSRVGAEDVLSRVKSFKPDMVRFHGSDVGFSECLSSDGGDQKNGFSRYDRFRRCACLRPARKDP